MPVLRQDSVRRPEVFQLRDLADVNVLRLRQFRQELVGYLPLKCRDAHSLHRKD